MKDSDPAAGSDKAGAPPTLIRSAEVRRRIGGISEATLWRYCYERKCAHLGFPKPAMKIRGQRFWLESEIDSFIEHQRAEST